MKTRKVFNTLLLVFISIALFLISYGLFFSTKYDHSYLETIQSKKQKLIETKYSKIVINGDINATTGIDSEYLEHELGVPVINMALNSSIGYKKILSYIKRDLNHGDILIFCPGYDIADSNSWKSLRPFEIKEANKIYKPEWFQSDNLTKDFYSKHVDLPYPSTEIQEVNFPDEGINFLRNYHEFLKKEGVSVYIYPLPLIKEGIEREQVVLFWETLSTQTGIPLLEERNAKIFERDNFIHAPNVFNLKGRWENTRSLAQRIKVKNVVPIKNTYVFPKEQVKSIVDLSQFNDFYETKIVSRNKDSIVIVPQKNNGYIRIKHKNSNFTNYSFSVEVECRKDILDQIKFMGVRIQDFDTIRKKEELVFELVKENINPVYFAKDNSSYIGLAFKDMDGSESITIKNVTLNNWPSALIFPQRKTQAIKITKGQILSFRILSSANRVRLTDIFSGSLNNDLILKTNTMYRLESFEKEIYIKDFYTGNNIFKFQFENDIELKSYDNSIIEVFEQ